MISCNEYDAIEIVCMHHYPIRIKTKSHDVIECIALDTALNESREECIKIKLKSVYHQDEKTDTQLVVLNEIAMLSVCVENPHFHVITFK